MGGVFKSLKGQLLLDGGKLSGSFFHRAVVFVCQHDAEGAFGLIINRPIGHTIQELSSEMIPETLEEMAVQVGGPVQPGALSFLITDSFLEGEQIIPDVSLGHSFEQLIELSETFSALRSVRLFSGYSGWSPGQLDEEIEKGSWMIQPATRKLLFDLDTNDLWRHIMYQQGWEERMLADSPDDLSSN
jgi:putative transcriptional regulator